STWRPARPRGPWQEGAWEITARTPSRVVFRRSMTVTRWSGTRFAVDVERTVSLLSRAEAARALGLAPGVVGEGAAFVGFSPSGASASRWRGSADARQVDLSESAWV